MKRREFITLLGGVAAWPLAVHAQQPKVVRLGYLDSAKPTDATAVNLRRQFLLGMRDLGYIEGRHFKMEDRYAEGRIDRLPALASELAHSPVDILLVFGDASIRAAMQASDTIPIVMTLAADPVGSGFVNSLAHPGGNVTGMSALAPRDLDEAVAHGLMAAVAAFGHLGISGLECFEILPLNSLIYRRKGTLVEALPNGVLSGLGQHCRIHRAVHIFRHVGGECPIAAFGCEIHVLETITDFAHGYRELR